jgi:large subunit ribosomal protein L24
MASSHVKRGDDVVVISGAHRGRRGKVLRVFSDGDRVSVEGVNLITKATRKSPQHPEGGLIKREGTVHLSNVMLASVFDASARRKAAKK